LIISIDGKKVELNSAETEDKKILLQEVKQILSQKGRVLRAVEVDGAALDEEAFEKLQSVGAVDFQSTSIRELVMESLESSETYLPTLINGMKRVATFLENHQMDEAMATLKDGVEGISWLLQVMLHSQFLLSVQDGDMGDGKIESHRNALTKALEKTSEYMENNQTEEMAASIRDDIVPLLEGLYPYIEELSSVASGYIQ
jgi:hypothetical protein